MTPKVAKLAAAYRVGFLGDNILETYFPFFANMILEKPDIQYFSKKDIRIMFKERYGVAISPSLVSSVLTIGVSNHSLMLGRNGGYEVVNKELKKYQFTEKESDFDEKWKDLVKDFDMFCRRKSVSLPDADNFLLHVIEHSDDALLEQSSDGNSTKDKCEIAWYNYVKQCSLQSPNMFEYISAICASNTLSAALIYYDDCAQGQIYSNLSIYLDTPIVFALLGIDGSQDKIDSSKQLLADLQAAGCKVYILDNCLSEIKRILSDASVVVQRGDFDVSKSNNAIRFFQRNMSSRHEILDYIVSLDAKVQELGIQVYNTDYDSDGHVFQVNESRLFDMIKDEYRKQGTIKADEKDASIQNDVRSISMLYRLRRGQDVYSLHEVKHLFLTYNIAVARISRNYQHQVRQKPTSIPVCISADLFGALLWMTSSREKRQYYQSRKLLSDCFNFLKPRKETLELYRDALIEARENNEVDDRKFVFLMETDIVESTLMRLYEGDYSLIDRSNIVQEVRDELKREAQEEGDRKFREEAESHKKTKEDLEAKDKEIDSLKATVNTLTSTVGTLTSTVDILTSQQKRLQEERITRLAVIFTGVILLLIIFGGGRFLLWIYSLVISVQMEDITLEVVSSFLQYPESVKLVRQKSLKRRCDKEYRDFRKSPNG